VSRSKQKSKLNKRQKEVVRAKSYTDMAKYAHNCMKRAKAYKMLSVFLSGIIAALMTGMFVLLLVTNQKLN